MWAGGEWHSPAPEHLERDNGAKPLRPSFERSELVVCWGFYKAARRCPRCFVIQQLVHLFSLKPLLKRISSTCLPLSSGPNRAPYTSHFCESSPGYSGEIVSLQPGFYKKKFLLIQSWL
jgi:hypothetical protein